MSSNSELITRMASDLSEARTQKRWLSRAFIASAVLFSAAAFVFDDEVYGAGRDACFVALASGAVAIVLSLRAARERGLGWRETAAAALCASLLYLALAFIVLLILKTRWHCDV